MTEGFLCERRILHGPWQALERAVARLLPYFQFTNVQLIGGPHDRGGDILAMRNDEKWVFQIKYASGSKIGERSITEVINAATFYGAQRAAVITNSYFSEDAYKARENFKSKGLEIEFWDGVLLAELFERIDPLPPNPPPLRPYQVDAVNALWGAYSNPEKRNALILMATGLGKTYVMANFISELTKTNPELSVLVLAHVKELILQLECAFWPHLSKQVTTHVWTGEEKPSFSEGITFATIQSIDSSSSKVRRSQYGIVIVDEAHHIGSESYQRTIKFLSPKFLIGMTATPWRLDKFKLSSIFGDPTYSISIVEGMDKGYLAEVDYRMLVDDVNWEELEKMYGKKYSVKELNRRLFLPGRDQAVIGKMKEHWQEWSNPRGMVFCRSIDHANQITALLNAAKFCNAVCISSKTPRRERGITLSKFREGKIDVLVTVDLLNEGIDVPEVNLIVFLRVTHSRRIFVQQLGRGLRFSKEKSKVKVLDFVSDVRRIAAGIELEEEHEEFKRQHPEILALPNRIIHFTNDKALSFFKEWLADIADVEDADEKAKLEFPKP